MVGCLFLIKKILKEYFSENEHLLNSVSGPVLVHNDLHFENILFAGDKITAMLDFDFAR